MVQNNKALTRPRKLHAALSCSWLGLSADNIAAIGRALLPPGFTLTSSSKDNKAVFFSVTLSIRNSPLLVLSLPCVSPGTNLVRSPDFPHERHANMSIHAIARLSRIHFKIQTVIIILTIIPRTVHGLVTVKETPVNSVLNLSAIRTMKTFTQSASLSTDRNPKMIIMGIIMLNNSSERQRPSKK